MHSSSGIALVGFIIWTLLLLLLMETARVGLVATRKFDARKFRPDNANLSPFMQRLARAHANCVESFPVFGGLLLAALVTGQTPITDPLAFFVLGARIVQSSVLAFTVQVVIALYWAYRLLAGVIE
jgi:uncharacterized MAPEG superfamily protein